MNWGANDLRRPSEYPRFMTKVARKLSKKYNCTMYYMPVNPVNSAMIMNCRGKYLRTEKLVDDFNRMIRRTLCSGKNKCYTYINSYDHFRKKGWISDTKNNSGVHDGSHYSVETSLRIYDYGKNKCYTYINSYDHFRKKGWISDTKNNSGVHDGSHYSVETSLRIYDYCIRFLNRER